MHFLVPTIQISTQWRRIVLFSGNGVSSREVKSESLEALKKCTTSYGGFYFSRLRSVLLPCQSWGPAGPRYSGWIWNESGHFIVFGREKLWDLVLLEKNSKPSGELEPGHKLLAVSSILILGGGEEASAPGLCFVILCRVVSGLFTMQHVLCVDIRIKVVRWKQHKAEYCPVSHYWNWSSRRQRRNIYVSVTTRSLRPRWTF